MKKHIEFNFEGTHYVVDVERKGDTLYIEKDGKIHIVDVKSEKIIEKDYKREPVLDAHTRSLTEDEVDTHFIQAPMPGTIQQIKVRIGDIVEKGQVLMVIEAMKMYLDIQSPGKGRVRDIYVKEQASVGAHEKLIRIE